MTHVLVTRAAADARWRALGTVTEAPLLTISGRAWQPPATPPEAIALTSANAVRHAGAAAVAYHDLPAFAVGATTAAAARADGWRDVRDGGGNAAAVFAAIASAGFGRVLHIAGVDRIEVALPRHLTIDVREVYAATLLDLPDAVLAALAAGSIDLVALYSPRSARHFAHLVDAAAIPRPEVTLATLSAAVAAAAGAGWRDVAVAAFPDDAALFAAAAALCDKRG